MKRYVLILLVIVFVVSALYSQQTRATINVFFSVPEYNDIFVEESTIRLTLGYSGRAGEVYEPDYLDVGYTITCSGAGKVLKARLDRAMPERIKLKLRATPPLGATSNQDFVTLNRGDQTIVTDLTGAAGGGTLRFELSAEPGAPTVTNDSRQVILTIMDG